MLFISCLVSSSVDVLKKMAVLFLLTFCLEAALYWFKMPSTLPYSSRVDLQNKRLSSANNKWVSLGPCRHRKKPLIYPIMAACWMSPCRPSVHRRKRKGDSVSPCLIPLVGCIMPWGSPFIRIEYVTILTHTITKPIHLSLKHIFLIRFSKYPHFTRS